MLGCVQKLFLFFQIFCLSYQKHCTWQNICIHYAIQRLIECEEATRLRTKTCFWRVHSSATFLYFTTVAVKSCQWKWTIREGPFWKSLLFNITLNLLMLLLLLLLFISFKRHLLASASVSRATDQSAACTLTTGYYGLVQVSNVCITRLTPEPMVYRRAYYTVILAFILLVLLITVVNYP